MFCIITSRHAAAKCRCRFGFRAVAWGRGCRFFFFSLRIIEIPDVKHAVEVSKEYEWDQVNNYFLVRLIQIFKNFLNFPAFSGGRQSKFYARGAATGARRMLRELKWRGKRYYARRGWVGRTKKLQCFFCEVLFACSV